jgi:ferredoxin--NADP+ reductase
MTQHNPKGLSPAAALPDAQEVTAVTHYTDSLFSFRITRPASLRFRSGEFVMIGLMGDPDPKSGRQKPLLRAYSIASPSWDDELEFYSIKVPDGPLTSRLQHLKTGDAVILRPKPVGTLVHDALLPGKRLYLFATGTGFAPFASLLREPETFERYEEIILTHTCRTVAELAYGKALIEDLRTNDTLQELLGAEAYGKIRYYPTTTRAPSAQTGRITTLIENGSFPADLGFGPFDPATDRAMVCGSLAFNHDIKALLQQAGLSEGSNSEPGHFVIEKAFVG